MPITNMPEGEIEVRVLMDWSSIEVFINNGQCVMTSQIFPNEPIQILSSRIPLPQYLTINELEVNRAESIW